MRGAGILCQSRPGVRPNHPPSRGPRASNKPVSYGCTGGAAGRPGSGELESGLAQAVDDALEQTGELDVAADQRPAVPLEAGLLAQDLGDLRLRVRAAAQVAETAGAHERAPVEGGVPIAQRDLIRHLVLAAPDVIGPDRVP